MTRTGLTLLFILLSGNLLFSQIWKVLHGTSARGGEHNTGTVFYLNPDELNEFSTLSFDKTGPLSPGGTLMTASDGFFYATTIDGGDFNLGTVIQFDNSGNAPMVVHHFNGEDGAQPYSTLIEGGDGKLYGTALEGGAAGHGSVFSVEKDGSAFALLHSFSQNDGSAPWAGLTEGSDGMLYGVTADGGAQDYGVVFRIGKDGAGFEVLHEFDAASEGLNSYCQLVEDDEGYFYGTLADGGTTQAGSVFRIKNDGSDFSILKYFAFSTEDGSSPHGSLIFASDGRLYGTTFGGGAEFKGTVFSLQKDGADFQINYSLSGNDGARPYFGNRLWESFDGFLYGATFSGGTENYGTLFKVAKDGSEFSVLKNFDGHEGRSPFSGVVPGPDGFLYGATTIDESTRFGLVYQIKPDGEDFSVLYDFTTANELGVAPIASLVMESMVGNATYGGANGRGTLFSINPIFGGDIEKKHDFEPATGIWPQAGLAFRDHMLYGTCTRGGTFNRGTIYRTNQYGENFEVIYHFTELTGDGAVPRATLTSGSDEWLYGATSSGGENGQGSLFRISANGVNYTQLFSFSTSETGGSPNEPLIEATDGKLYGVTPFGGTLPDGDIGGGTVFSVQKDGSGFTIIHTFSRSEHGAPSGPLLEVDGWLYGNTNFGAAYESGAVYRLKPDGSEFELLHEFLPEEGISPQGALVKDIQLSQNWIYGVTRLGGEFGHGTAFRIRPDGSELETLKNFAGMPGGPSQADGGMVWDFIVNTQNLPRLTGLSLAPNPTAGELRFVWENDFPSQQSARVRIVDGGGALVFQGNTDLQTVNEQLRQTSPKWGAGLYFVEVEMEGKVFVEKLVKGR